MLALSLFGAGLGCRPTKRDDPGASAPPAQAVRAATASEATEPLRRPASPRPPKAQTPPPPQDGPPTYGPAKLTMLGDDERATLLAGDADDPMVVDTHYIQSNETRHDLFFDYIDGIGGAFVGVGSDQNYTIMAKARSEYAFVLDIDDRVVDLHRVYEAFIVESETPADLVAWWDDDHAESSIDFIREHFAEDPRLRFLVATYRSGRETVHRHLLRVVERTVDGKPVSWLSDPDLYAHVRAMFQSRRVRIMVGNLAGPKSMKTVAAATEALGTQVRVYYPSNAEDYYRYDRNYRENVRAFPAADNSVVVRTIYRKEWEHADLWAYQVQPLTDLQERLAVVKNRSRKSMLRLAEADGDVQRDTGVTGLSLVGFEK